MRISFAADVLRESIPQLEPSILERLLIDQTTTKNIIWATNDYEVYGPDYGAKCHITLPLITGLYGRLISPRVKKTKEYQANRTRDKAEVFTPSWVCNEQNNLVDEQWFGREGVFNSTHGKRWTTSTKKIIFPDAIGKQWENYVDARRMEISCGEAPYLTSRYDVVTGKSIPLHERIGLLDRKLRVVNENTDNEEDWYKWALRALQSTYGYEYQGDSLLLARKNLLFTFIENALHKLNETPNKKILDTAAQIISWNVWQMDGLKYTVPFGKLEESYSQLNFFDILGGIDTPSDSKSQPCKIMDWRAKRSVVYASLVERRNNA